MWHNSPLSGAAKVREVGQEHQAPVSTSQVIDALIGTLEQVLPHAAQLVEQKTQELVEHITALVGQAGIQEQHLARVLGAVQHMRIDPYDLPLGDYLRRLQVSLTFSLESNLHFANFSGQWARQLQEHIRELHPWTKEAEALSEQASGPLKPFLRDLARHMQQAHNDLSLLHEEIATTTVDRQQRAIYTQDLKTIARIIADQPHSMQQLTQLLSEATQSARHITDAGRSAIMAIQFQDRHSQLIENSVRLLARLRQGISHPEADGAAYYQACSETISMGDVRNIFTGLLPSAMQGNHHPATPADSGDDAAIELF